MAEHTETSTAPMRKVLWLKDLPERLGVSSVTIWRARGKKKFPEPTCWLDKKPGWAVKVIEMWEEGYAHELIAAFEAKMIATEQPVRTQEGMQRDEQVGRSRKGTTQPHWAQPGQ